MTWQTTGDLTEYFTSFAIGVRFAPNYVLGDHLGKIFDDILNSGNEFFGRDVLRYNQRTINHGVLEDKIPDALTNVKPTKALTVEPRNIVLDYTPDNIEDIRAIVTGFSKLILNKLMKEHKVKGIARIGYINRYELESEDAICALMDRTVPNAEDVHDLSLRFSRRRPTDITILYKGIQNWHNLIYNLARVVTKELDDEPGEEYDKESLQLSLDYQLHFDPPLATAEEIPFAGFVKDVVSYNRTRLPKWFSKFIGGKA